MLPFGIVLFQYFVAILCAFLATVQGGTLGESGCDDFYFIGLPGESGLGASRGLCPLHLLFLRSVISDLFRTRDAMAKTCCPSGDI